MPGRQYGGDFAGCEPVAPHSDGEVHGRLAVVTLILCEEGIQAAANPHIAPFIHFALKTGMRRGKIPGMT